MTAAATLRVPWKFANLTRTKRDRHKRFVSNGPCLRANPHDTHRSPTFLSGRVPGDHQAGVVLIQDVAGGQVFVRGACGQDGQLRGRASCLVPGADVVRHRSGDGGRIGAVGDYSEFVQAFRAVQGAGLRAVGEVRAVG